MSSPWAWEPVCRLTRNAASSNSGEKASMGLPVAWSPWDSVWLKTSSFSPPMVTVLKVSKISKERPSKLYVYMRAFQFGLPGAQTEGIKVAFIQELKLARGDWRPGFTLAYTPGHREADTKLSFPMGQGADCGVSERRELNENLLKWAEGEQGGHLSQGTVTQ